MSSLVLENKRSNIVEYKFHTIFNPTEVSYTLSSYQRIPLMLTVKAFIFFSFRDIDSPFTESIRVIIDNVDDLKDIEELESIFEVENGEIATLVEKASHSDNQKAEKNDLKVELNVSTPDLTRLVSIQDSTVSGMKFFELTELSHSLLNDAIAAYSNIIHRVKFRKEPLTEGLNLEEVVKNRSLAQEILNKSDKFSSIREMQLIIDNYTPIVKELYRA